MRAATPNAILRGLGRALASPKLVFWLWLAGLLAALPGAVMITDSIHSSLGDSLVADELTDGFDLGWFGEYRHAARGIERTLAPSLVGAGAFFDNLEAWFSGEMFTGSRALLAMGIGFALVWALLLGGVLEQLHRPAPVLALDRFLASGGRYFARFVRLAALGAGLYYLVYKLARSLFPWIERATRDVTVEKSVLTYNLLGALLVVFLLLAVRTALDYGKIAIVADGRRSAVLALVAGLRFVLFHPLATLGAVLAYALLGAAALALYTLVAPGAGQSTWLALAVALVVSQAFLAAKLGLRVALLATEVELYRGASRRRTLRTPL